MDQGAKPPESPYARAWQELLTRWQELDATLRKLHDARGLDIEHIEVIATGAAAVMADLVALGEGALELHREAVASAALLREIQTAHLRTRAADSDGGVD